MNYQKLFLLVLIASAYALPVFAQEQQFVPLTNLPGLSDFQNSPNFAGFLNSLYKICIGVAAALAVFQIMHAGIKFMTNKGSISENEQAKDLIRGAVLGLILVLSPVIVFGIINPKILELDLDVSKLQQIDLNDVVETGGGGDGGTETGGGGTQSLARASFHSTAEAASKWLDDNCANSMIPESVRDIAVEYNRDQKLVACNATARARNACTADDKTHRAICEADSKDFRVFRDRSWANQWNPTNWFDSEWRAIPGTDKTLFDRFSGICTSEKGRVNIESDRDFNLLTLASSGCSSAEVERIGEGNWMCVEARAVCEVDW